MKAPRKWKPIKTRSQRISRITKIVQSIKNLSFAVVVNGSLQRSRSRLPKIARRIVRHGESVSPVGRIRPVADRWRIDLVLAGFLKDDAQVPTPLFQFHARRLVAALRELTDHACPA